MRLAAPTPDKPLNVRQARFAELVVALGSQRYAYAEAYGLPVSAAVDVDASRLVSDPRVAARIREYRAQAVVASSRTIEERIAELEAMLDADPVSQVRVYGCRHCATGRYQYVDDRELAHRVQAALVNPANPAPDVDGDISMGFIATAPVNPVCAECKGAGVQVVVHTDSQALTAGQRSAVHAIKADKGGGVIVETLSKLEIRKLLHALRGDLVQRSENRNYNLSATVPVPEQTTPDALLAAYHRSRGVVSP
jgi:hypothetical protein